METSLKTRFLVYPQIIFLELDSKGLAILRKVVRCRLAI